MKITTIGDIHGNDAWKKAIYLKSDLYVFIGDYTDHWTRTDDQIFENLLDIIQFKKDNEEKVVLLIGNHDSQYIWGNQYQCSGYRPSMHPALECIFKDNIDYFKIAHQVNCLDGQRYLWTHAGVTQKWWNKYSNVMIKDFLPEDAVSFQNNFAFMLNESVKYNKYREAILEVGPSSGGYRYDTSGPLWARPDDIRATYPFDDECHQICGHTPYREIKTLDKFQDKLFPNATFTFTDVLDHIDEFHTIKVQL